MPNSSIKHNVQANNETSNHFVKASFAIQKYCSIHYVIAIFLNYHLFGGWKNFKVMKLI